MSFKDILKNSKRVLSLVMVVILSLGISVSAADYSIDDTVIHTISSLGLMPYAEDIKSDGVVTRSQMVISILNFMGLGDSVPQEASEYTFDDVDYSKKDGAYIQFAYSMKLVSGVSATEFYPDTAATLPQAAKLIVTALGYDVVAETKGGYAAGYITMASNQGLLKGIDVSDSNELTYLDFAKLLYNGLNTPVFKRDAYGDNNTYSQSSTTAFVENLGYKSVRGVVTETNTVNIYGSSITSGKNQVFVGNQKFVDNDSGIKDYLGYTAEVYYKDSDSKIPEIAFFVLDKYNETLSLSSDDISDFSFNGSVLSVTYFNEKDKPRTERMAANAYLYNGYSATALQIENKYTSSLSSDDEWSVTLIDNDLDGNYEVVKIDDYTSYLIKRVNSYSKIVYYYDYADLTMPKSISFDALNDEDYDDDYTIYGADGNEIEFSDLEPDTVISVYENLPTTTHRIVRVSDKTVTGEVTGLSSNGKCIIDGTEYKVATSLKDKMLGEKGVFYLDIYGKIIGKKTSEDVNGGYGLLMDVYVPNISLIDNYPVMRVLTSDGEIKDFKAENDINAYNPNTCRFQKTAFRSLVNTATTTAGYDRVHDYMIWHTDNKAGFTYDTKHDDYTKEFYYRPWLSDEEKSDIASRKPIYYKLNKDGRINTVIVPNIPVAENKMTLLNDDNRYTFTYNSSSGMVLDTGANSSGDVPHFRIAKDATVFSVLALDYSLQDYSVPQSGVSIIPNSSSSKMKLYSLNESDREAQLVVAYAHLPYEYTGNMQYVVVDKVLRDINDKITLYGFSQGREYKATIKNDTRLIEKIYNSSNTEYNSGTKITANNILNYTGYAYGGTGAAPYDIAASTASTLLNHPSLNIGSQNPYADETSLKRGDIVVVGKNKTDEVCYVEMAMRASDCVMLIPQTSDDWYGRFNSSRSYFKGVVTSVSGEEEVFLRIIGEYTGINQRLTTPAPNYRATAFFDDRNVPYDFTACKYVWVYDYNTNKIEVVDGYSIEPGDVIVGKGSGLSPSDCIILKNYPAEPDFSYWQLP